MFRIEFTSWGLSKLPNDFDKNYVFAMVQKYSTADEMITFLSYLAEILPEDMSLLVRQLYTMIKAGFIREGVISL